MQVPTIQEIKSVINLSPEALAEAPLHMEGKRKESEIFSLGLRFFKYKRLDLSLVFFNKVIEINDKNAQAYVNIGNIYYEHGQIDIAANFWKYALSIDATIEKAYLNLGNYYYKKGNIDQAISYWLILQSISPTENNSLFNLGVSYGEKNELLLSLFYFEKYLAKAITQKGSYHYEKAAKKVWDHKVAAKHNFNIGLKLQRRKSYPRALKAYIKTIKAYPNHIKGNINAGSICYLNDKLENAVKFWNNVLILEPYNEQNLVNIAIAYDRMDKHSYAFCLYNRYLRTQENHSTFEIVKIKDRLKILEKNLEDRNTFYNLHYTKAEEFFRKKDFLNACSEYENCLMLKPDNEELEEKIERIRSALYPEANLAIAYIKTGKKALRNSEILSAVEHFRAAYNLNPNEESLSEIKENMAKCVRILKKIGKL